MDDLDVYQKLFLKMSKIGFPDKYKGINMVYYFKECQSDIKLFPTDKKLLKMWELLESE